MTFLLLNGTSFVVQASAGYQKALWQYHDINIVDAMLMVVKGTAVMNFMRMDALFNLFL